MHIIVGLGNPGKKYEQTRHNLGFMVVDCLAKDMGIDVKKRKFSARIGEGIIGGEKVILVKPQTYMNLSGVSVQKIVNYYNIDHDKLILIYDDMDIEMGALRIRKKGSPGTHNGMKSVVNSIGFSDFPRLRIGIGEKENDDAISFVIGNISSKEKDAMNEAVCKASKACQCIITDGIDIAMNRYNGNV